MTDQALPSLRLSKARKFLADSRDFIAQHSLEWSLTSNSTMETINHLLRVWIQDGTSSEHESYYNRICQLQHADGGWSERIGDSSSRARTTAFTTQMLMRVQDALPHLGLSHAINRGLDYILREQTDDGTWHDIGWHYWDATSVALGTILYAEHSQFSVPFGTARDKALAIVLQGQHDNGGWYYHSDQSPTCITAHLLQKCVLAGLDENVIRRGAELLLSTQSDRGDWDNGDLDHTCDATRCLMLTDSRYPSLSLSSTVGLSATRAVDWILDQVKEGGLGARPSARSTVLFTCDGIDTVLKWMLYVQRDHKAISRSYQGCLACNS